MQNNQYGKNEMNPSEMKVKSTTTINVWRYRAEGGVVGAIIAGALIELIRYFLGKI